jgi:hypothetical protein
MTVMLDIDLKTLTAQQGTRVAGADGATFGNNLAAAGDVNGDGVDDFIVSGGYGGVWIVHGRAGGFGATLDLGNLGALDGTFLPKPVSDRPSFGWAVAGVGDVNGDGLDDVAIGSPIRDPLRGETAGVVYVAYGREGGLGAELALDTLGAEQGFSIYGYIQNDYNYTSSLSFGFDVAGLGDVNGDGLADVGALSSRGNALLPLYIAAIYGDADRNPNVVALDGLAADEGLVWNNNGITLTGVGDVNGDGRDDVLIGGAQGAILLFGQDGDWSPVDYGTLTPDRGIAIHTTDPTTTGAIGPSIARAGDVNGDGIADMLLTATTPHTGNRSPSVVSNAPVVVLYGRQDGFEGDVDVASLTPAQGFRIISSVPGEIIGSTIAAAGDVNGDGLDDILILAAPSAGPYPGYLGVAAYVVFGRLGGFPAVVDLATLEEDQGFRIGHADVIDSASQLIFLPNLSSAGDVNADGADDLLLRFADLQQTQAYLIYGTAEALDWVGSNGADARSGTNFDDLFSGRGGADWMRGRGGEDSLLGGAGADTAEGGDGDDLLDGGRDWDLLRGGAGRDTLIGGEGGDTLDGGTGADLLIGGAGFDVFVIDDAGDVIVDDPASSGLVESSIAWRLMGSHLFLTLTGTEAINGWGTASGDVMAGNDAANRLAGRDGRDRLGGGGGNDRLLGEGGDDTLTGQEGDDVLMGGDGADSLDGGTGLDRLTGGLGADQFRFGAAPLSLAADRIYDFSAIEGDRIVISLAAFDPGGVTGLVAGSLAAQAGRFQASLSGAAATAETRFIYETDAGRLYFDADGRGGEAGVLAARLNGAPAVLAGDIWLE